MQIRLQHYEEKRKAKIRTISDSIKENLLDQFKARYESEQASPSKNLNSPASPQRVSAYHNSSPPVDIPLREPYGAESYVKKQARIIMAAERWSKHETAMESLRLNHEKDLSKLQNKELEKNKKAITNVKETNQDTKDKMHLAVAKVEATYEKKKGQDLLFQRNLRD